MTVSPTAAPATKKLSRALSRRPSTSEAMLATNGALSFMFLEN